MLSPAVLSPAVLSVVELEDFTLVADPPLVIQVRLDDDPYLSRS